jgi:hypothetical protein
MATFTIGHICLPTDNVATHNGALLNTATGLIDANFTTVAAQDWGGVLPGIGMALGQESPGSAHVFLYDLSFTLAHTVTLASTMQGLTSDYVNTYYCTLNNGGSAPTVKSVTSAGTIGGTTWTITNVAVSGTAVSPGAGILYFGDASNGAIHRWNLSTNLVMTDLVGGTSSRFIADNMICLPLGDRAGDILMPAQTNKATDVWQIERYTAAGALAQSYPLPTTSDADGNETIQIAVDLQYPNTFWVRTFTTSDGNTTVVTQYSLNGTQLQQFTLLTTSDPNTVAPCCPIFGWSQVLVPPPPGPPFNPQPLPPVVGTRQTVPIRRLRRTAQMTDELLWLFISEFQLMLQPGVGNPNDPGSNPKIALRWSNDGGHSWSNQREVSVGAIGQYGTRAIWRMLSRARNRVWEISMSDPVLWAIVDAFAVVQEQAKP